MKMCIRKAIFLASVSLYSLYFVSCARNAATQVCDRLNCFRLWIHMNQAV